MAKKFYAVRKGKVIGIFESWNECKDSVSGFSGAEYKSFTSFEEADDYMKGIESSPKDGQLSSMDEIDYSLPYAFVDGSFNPATNVYGCGGYLVSRGNKYLIKACDDDEEMATMRNVAGEVLGAMLAIDKAIEIGIHKLIIYYDYEGIKHWAEGTWKRNKTGTIEYYKYIQSVKDVISLEFIHAKAHSGIEGNENADKIAKEAVGIL